MEAAKRFFKQAADVVGHRPKRVTTDGHDSYPRAVREILGSNVLHRTNRYLNNRLEQDHRGIKQRYYPMRGFGSVASASRFCRAFEEVRQFFRVRTTMKQQVSLAQQREAFHLRLEALKAMVLGAQQRRMAGEKCPIRLVNSCVLSSDASSADRVLGERRSKVTAPWRDCILPLPGSSPLRYNWSVAVQVSGRTPFCF
jgi:DDE domain